jgi:hypothetical protein
MTAQRWTVTQELQGALVVFDEATPDNALAKIELAREAIERALSAIQNARCDAQTALDRF